MTHPFRDPPFTDPSFADPAGRGPADLEDRFETCSSVP